MRIERRTTGYKCSICSRHKLVYRVNDFATIELVLVTEFHSYLNGLKAPDRILPGDNLFCWKCLAAGDVASQSVPHRRRSKGCTECPPELRSLASEHWLTATKAVKSLRLRSLLLSLQESLNIAENIWPPADDGIQRTTGLIAEKKSQIGWETTISSYGTPHARATASAPPGGGSGCLILTRSGRKPCSIPQSTAVVLLFAPMRR